MSASQASADERKHPGLNLGRTDPAAHAEAEEIVFGFWVFLMTDLVLFALLFATYGTMLGRLAGSPGANVLFDIKSAAMETAALLLSSFSFGMASLAMKYGHRRGVLLSWLAVTLGLGMIFLGLEIHDFISMIHNGGAPERSGFDSAFFALVGTHGLHVTLGIVWIVVMMVQVQVFGCDRAVKIRILRLGLFWHFLDIIWVGIFSVVYLQGLA
ncbi:cytochrome c oxidase subunit 3 [Rhodopila sp.]|uniref:cytochrome c oxidase subunit 3 n=1 Tax=Rhodopila sp. TaxID=2480087 RepID=UPI003D0C8A31